MSKTFKSVTDNESELDVRANDCGVFIAFSRAGQIRQASTFATSDAPALALAVLEAAGVEAKPSNDDPGTPGNLGRIAYQLMIHIEDAENIIAEARERAELEAEAVELFNANHGTNRTDWDHADRSVISSWVRVARRSREIAKEATK